ncbi:uncharacterized protein [Salvelinus alpinus]|uniref:uncharacterized protein n=1 Tax=Salvelinus alpinus TaxID=8036 RepID=UPI0039FB9C2C
MVSCDYYTLDSSHQLCGRLHTSMLAENMADTRFLERAEDFRSEDGFQTNAAKIICGVVELCANHENMHIITLAEEMLHSIFFLGNIHVRKCSPEMILSSGMLERVRKVFPRPLASYSTKLPRRTPFSCLLDMVVTLRTEEDTEDDIKNHLSNLITRLGLVGDHNLIAATICVSYYTDDQHKPMFHYYGASLSSTGYKERKILIASSCVHTWHHYVSLAVMEKTPVTFIRPVRCRAFSVDSIHTEKPPCKPCRELFKLEHADPPTGNNIYGNCAEVESLSKLLWNEDERLRRVRDRTGIKTKAIKTLSNRLKEFGLVSYDADEVFRPPPTRRI